MIPLSDALQYTETTTLIANQVVYLTQGLPASFVIALIMIITMCLWSCTQDTAIKPDHVLTAELYNIVFDRRSEFQTSTIERGEYYFS